MRVDAAGEYVTDTGNVISAAEIKQVFLDGEPQPLGTVIGFDDEEGWIDCLIPKHGGRGFEIDLTDPDAPTPKVQRKHGSVEYLIPAVNGNKIVKAFGDA